MPYPVAAAKGKIIVGATPPYYQRILNTNPANLDGAWPLWDVSGLNAINLVVNPFTGELGPNGNLEYGYGVWDYAQVGSGAIADEGVLVHTGINAVKLTAGATANTYIRNTIRVSPSSTVTLKFWTRGDGTYGGRYGVKNYATGGWIRTVVATGVTGTTYTEVTYVINVPVTTNLIQVFLYCPSDNTGIAYFDDVTFTGTIASDNGYQAAETTYGEAGIGDGKTSVKLSGTNSSIGMGGGYFNSIWNGDVGSAIAWGKVSAAGIWTDASMMRYLFHVKSDRDSTHYLVFGKNQTNHTIEWRRRVSGSIYSKTYTFAPTGTLDWFCMGFIWDVISSPKRMAGYLYTKANTTWQKVFDEAPATGEGPWGTHQVLSDEVLLGGGDYENQLWSGWMAHAYYWPGIVLSDAEMQKVMTP